MIVTARRHSGDGPLTLAAKLGLAASTVGKVLRRSGCSRRPRAPRAAVVRYERERPGELLHIDIKKLGRFWEVGKRIRQDGVRRSPHAGWQYLHVAVDDHSRLAYAELLPSERAEDAVAFLRRAVAWYREQGVETAAVLTDNGVAYRSHRWRESCGALGLRHLRTRPYTPRTNGKAERSSRPCSGSGPTATSTRPAPTAPVPFRLAAVVQPKATPRLARWPPTRQPRLTPLWSLHLAHSSHLTHVIRSGIFAPSR